MSTWTSKRNEKKKRKKEKGTSKELKKSLESKYFSCNIIEAIKPLAVPIVSYSGSFFK